MVWPGSFCPVLFGALEVWLIGCGAWSYAFCSEKSQSRTNVPGRGSEFRVGSGVSNPVLSPDSERFLLYPSGILRLAKLSDEQDGQTKFTRVRAGT